MVHSLTLKPCCMSDKMAAAVMAGFFDLNPFAVMNLVAALIVLAMPFVVWLLGGAMTALPAAMHSAAIAVMMSLNDAGLGAALAALSAVFLVAFAAAVLRSSEAKMTSQVFSIVALSFAAASAAACAFLRFVRAG